MTDPCPADLDCDGEVGVLDLLQLLGNWGPCGQGAQSPPKTVQDCVDRFSDEPLALERCLCAIEPESCE